MAQPSGHPGISIGFFLVELAKVLQDFGDDYDLVFATPRRQAPQLDINGMALSFHAVPGLGPATARAAVAQATRFDADTFRQRRPQLVARRDAELATAYQLLGGLPVSQPLPNTDKEAKLSGPLGLRREGQPADRQRPPGHRRPGRQAPATPRRRNPAW